jgi:AcrR family transcriptional regulator
MPSNPLSCAVYKRITQALVCCTRDIRKPYTDPVPKTRSAQGDGDLPPITQRMVLDAAIRLVRAHGVDGLSVRRVASELDVWPTTIYYHVGGTKNGLLALTLDAIAGELELPASGDRPWPEAVEEIACLLRARIAGYPGVAAYLLTAPAPGPNAQRIMERLLALLTEGAGLPVLAAFDAYQVLMAFVLNSVQRAEQGTTASRVSRYAELGARDDLPLTALVARALPADDDERFLGGLRIVIAGIAATR